MTPDRREHLEKAKRCGFSLLDLLNDLLDLARIESGKLTIEHHAFDPAALLESFVNGHSHKAAAKGARAQAAHSAGNGAAVESDASRIRQMLENSLSNAVKFTERGSVTVTGSSVVPATGQGDVKIDVHDTGAGIASEKLPIIFESFTQSDGSVSR